MSVACALPRRSWRAARRRDLAILVALGLPWLAAGALLAQRLGGAAAGRWTLLALVAVLALAAMRVWRARDAVWLVRALNARRPDMEDSADLLCADAASTELQQLQRQRLLARLGQNPADLRAPWPRTALLGSLLLAAAVGAAVLVWPSPAEHATLPPAGDARRDDAAVPQLRQARIDVEPPAYTGRAARTESSLSLRAEAGARLRWRLDFSPPPQHAALVLLDGRRLPLTREGERGDWISELALERALLYRLEADGRNLSPAPERLDLIPDRPPQIRLLAPETSLTLATRGQRQWSIALEADDDYGLAPDASLIITHTQGSGESIAVNERRLRLRGEGDARRQRYAHTLDLRALGFAEGDDLIVQLRVRDTRAPQPQEARSASLILRWAPASGAPAGEFEAAVRRVMPAYFRSQRQIILDAEALLREQAALAPDRFAQRSDALGVDQRILRLRYGQFMGEESEDAGARGHDEHADEHTEEHGEHAGHDHGQGAPAQATELGRDMDLIAAFGHTHDIPEAATLLDPRTRATLRRALDQMWQSELGLRQAQPAQSLPHAYRALELIKEVQQAERIYLARTDSDLPPIDFGRRLGGKREGLASRPDPLRPARDAAPDPGQLWRALEDPDAPPPDAALLERARAAALADEALDLAAAIDTLAQQPDCRHCRAALRAALWSRLRLPAAAVPRRAAADAHGARYLDALDETTP